MRPSREVFVALRSPEYFRYHNLTGLVQALRYKPVGRGFDFRWCHNPSGRTVALGLTQPLTEMSTRNISWGVKAAGGYG